MEITVYSLIRLSCNFHARMEDASMISALAERALNHALGTNCVKPEHNGKKTLSATKARIYVDNLRL